MKGKERYKKEQEKLRTNPEKEKKRQPKNRNEQTGKNDIMKTYMSAFSGIFLIDNGMQIHQE